MRPPIAGRTNVVIGAGDTRAARHPALDNVARHLVATIFKQDEKFQKFAGVCWVHGNIEAICGSHRHHSGVAVAIDAALAMCA